MAAPRASGDSRRDRAAGPPTHRGELTVADLTVSVPGHAAPVLRRLSLELPSGMASCVVGRSGTGKTTLLHAISGLLPWQRPGAVTGRVELSGEPIEDLDPGQRSHLVATCLDRAHAQLFLTTPRQEVAAARRLYGEAPLLEPALDELGLRSTLDQRTSQLSSGECQRLALAVALAGSPRPVLLDEPTAHLDASAVAALGRLLDAATGLGGSVLLTEQAGWRLADAVSSWWSIERGGLRPAERPLPPVLPSPGHQPGPEVVLELRGVTVERGGRVLLGNVDLRLKAGEIVFLSGPNGAGKSTLAEVAAGLRRPACGAVQVAGHAALMLPGAELQLFATTVAGEVRARGGSEPRARVLRVHRLEHLAGRAPWTLSRGERQRLVHAALDLQRPPVMVVDEPAQGLHHQELAELVELIHRRAERGRAYLVISHREELAAVCHRHLRVVAGGLEEG